MSWKIHFHDAIEDSVLTIPSKIQARMMKPLALMEKHGAHLRPPHTEAMGDGLFEIRAKAQEGIGRNLLCYLEGQQILVLHALVKKQQKTPKKELELAKSRQKEVQSS